MTKETERGIKLDFYHECKEKAVNCLTAMGAKTKDGCVDEHSWECLMQLHSDVKRRSTNEDERSAADLAAMKWMWAHLECEEEHHVREAEEMISREVAAAHEDSAHDAESVAKVVPAK